MLTSNYSAQRCTSPKTYRTSSIFWKAFLIIFLLTVFILLFLLHNFINLVPLESQTSKWHTALPVEEIWVGGKDEEAGRQNNEEKEILAALKTEIEELKTIKMTVINELRDMEGKRHSILEEIKNLDKNKAIIAKEVKQRDRDLNKLKNQLVVLRSAVASKKLEVNIPIGIPKQLKEVSRGDSYKKFTSQQSRNNCGVSNCFDYSHCSLLNQFSVFVYNPSPGHALPIDVAETRAVYKLTKKLPHVVDNNAGACLFMEILILTSANVKNYKKGALLKHLRTLRNWESNGQNHLLLFISKLPVNQTCKYIAEIVKTRAIVATNVYCKNLFRRNFDILINPKEFFLIKDFQWDSLQPLVPVKRKYLFAFIEKSYSYKVSTSDLLSLKGTVPDVYIKVSCNKLQEDDLKDLKQFCNDGKHINDVLNNSIFNLVFGVENWQELERFFTDILTSLRNGAIPVIIGGNNQYPYSDFIDYKKFTISMPLARLTELHYILRTMKKSDIFFIRKQGRFMYQTYFSTLRMNTFTVFSIIQSRINLPPLPLEDVKAVPLLMENTTIISGSKYESLTLKSSMYKRNWTDGSVNLYDNWNVYPGAHYLFEFRPKNDALPPSVQFFEDVHDYMPIANGVGGDGRAFKHALGGDQAVEHFTVVILTYDRELILIESLQRLANLRYLNRVIVIWNNKVMPSSELEWPDIGVPLHVVKGEKNSLNNRFMPFDLIDTEAILSMDDDIYLRFDEIELAFRVWRENRDRIVGFPGRYHSWNNGRGWSYNASNSCELSMVLTGGAFFHKYYLYLYTYLMPQPIRDMVDEYMNCEDIAMNFLVSHVTGRPPIKVTSRWTFRCPGCPTSLSNDHTHYTERARCLQFFKEVYGYMPLRRTQFRADSVLFKTRLSPGGVKCYQFV